MGFQSFVKDTSNWINDKIGSPSGPINPPFTQTASSHSIVIKTGDGKKIGRIQSWNPTVSRTIDSIYEVHADATGEPIECIPQIQTTNTIAVNRYELYSAHIGEAFGVKTGLSNDDLYTLILQKNPINIREIWRDPYGGLRAYVYAGCYFNSLGQTIAATDDRILKVNASLTFTRKLRMI